MQVDARDMKCPRPVVLTLGALPKLAPGESLEVLVNESVAQSNVERLGADKDCEVTVVDRGDHTAVVLTPRGTIDADAAAAEAAEATCEIAPRGSTVYAIGSDTMGRGEEELGHILMNGLIYAISQQDPTPRTMVFFNSGAHLTCEGSKALEDIRALEAAGTEILTCGTCLDFYGIKDKLGVGGVTNLFQIAQILSYEPHVVNL